MMKERRKERSISALCAPVLLLMLAAGILTVLLGSAGIYRRQNRLLQESEDRRNGVLYLTNQVRQAPDGVTVEPFGQGNALVIREQVGNSGYITRIYCFDGWLRQLLTPDSGEFAPEDGEKVMPLAALDLTVEQGLLTAALTDTQGNMDVLKIRTGEGAQP